MNSRLRTVDVLLADTDPELAAIGPRASAWMLRIAVEQAIGELWDAVSPAMRRVTVRAQLLVLPKYVGEEVAGEVRLLWSQLSSTTHHNDFELAPALSELRRWQESVTRVTEAMGRVVAA
ncbi:hypothetical protein GCM10011591_43890 [Nocardia camponoti]|uniref:Uncharacterized protein n=1 Tax=Nocardia camponoti TaxID=1616106 RepID=A0A917QTY1_9NOCA|nr:hypothetical protein GCM10011591_43890 [Nocardia camponoti]